jgi:hypothetical protein
MPKKTSQGRNQDELSLSLNSTLKMEAVGLSSYTIFLLIIF